MQSAIVRLLSQALRAYRGDLWRPSACRSRILLTFKIMRHYTESMAYEAPEQLM